MAERDGDWGWGNPSSGETPAGPGYGPWQAPWLPQGRPLFSSAKCASHSSLQGSTD